MHSLWLAVVLVFSTGVGQTGEPAVVGPEGLTREGRVSSDDPKVRIEGGPEKTLQLPAKSFAVRLKAGKRYRITLKGDDFDPVVVVRDGKGRQRGWDDDNGGNLDSLLTLDVVEGGDFTVYAATLDRAGAFRLSVKEAGAVKVHDVGADLKLEGKLGPDRATLYSVRLEAGKKYVMEMTSPDGKELDPLLALEDDEGKRLAVDDDGGEGLNSRLVHQAARAGVYRLVAACVGDGQGPFTVRVRPATADEPGGRR